LESSELLKIFSKARGIQHYNIKSLCGVLDIRPYTDLLLTSITTINV